MDTRTDKIPTEQVVRDAANAMFETESGLHIKEETWSYIQAPKRGIAQANFALADNDEIVFSNVKLLALYVDKDSCKVRVQASINGLSPTYREFYVVEECIELTEAVA